jgi:hypothetical protein
MSELRLRVAGIRSGVQGTRLLVSCILHRISDLPRIKDHSLVPYHPI